MEKIWLVKPAQPKIQCRLSKDLEISPITSQLLINRGITSSEEAKKFLSADINFLSDPLKIFGVREACDRLLTAIKKNERILIYGDYDVDGVTASAVMIEFFENLGIDTICIIPNRLDNGYGLSKDMMDNILTHNCSLMITVDCGINSVAEVEILNKAGIDTIITDHHQPGEELPQACAIVNPKLGSPPEAADLAGVGVAFMVLRALAQELRDDFIFNTTDLLDLVALGTVADIVPLVGDNRIIVKYGIKDIMKSRRPGLKALIDSCGFRSDNLTTMELSYGLVPRLNAAGRLDDCKAALELLLTKSIQRAVELANYLNRMNQERQVIEGAITKLIDEMITESVDLQKEKIIVLASELWHPGVIGIVASKISTKLNKPVVLIAIDGDEGRGSARSIDGCNIYDGLKYCSSLLSGFGGHAQAAGLTIQKDRIDKFRNQINKWAYEYLPDKLFIPRIYCDTEVLLSELDMDLVKEIQCLAPFGEGNPSPLFMCTNAAILSSKRVGKQENHLKLFFADDYSSLEGIGFNMGTYQEMAASGETLNLAFSLDINTWNGQQNLQLNIKDLKTNGSLIAVGSEKNAPAKMNSLPVNRHSSCSELYFLANFKEVYQEIMFIIESSTYNSRIYFVASSPCAVQVLYEYFASILKKINIYCWLISNINSDEEIQWILDEHKSKGGVIFTSLWWWKFHKEYLVSDDYSAISILSTDDLSNIHLCDDSISKNYIIGPAEQKTIISEHVVHLIKSCNEELDTSQIIVQSFHENLANWLNESKSLVLWADNIINFRRIMKTVEKYVPVRDVSIWHGELNYYKQMEMIEKFNQGITKVMISTLALPRWKLGVIEDEYFFDFFTDIFHFNYHMMPFNNIIKIIGNNLFADMKKSLEAMYPTRQSMKVMYGLARNHDSQIKEITESRVVAALNKLGFSTTKNTYKQLLNIFSELNIRGLSNEAKVDLHNSWRYLDNSHQHTLAEAFLNRVIQGI
ncbi:MAG: single-stranded-DNA-specific exonuclease RecJ [Bacillota bacterium]